MKSYGHNFSVYLHCGKLYMIAWHGNKYREYNITEKAAIAITTRLVDLGFLFMPRLGQFGWWAGKRISISSFEVTP